MNTLDEKLSRLEVMLREQQTEIASLREALAHKNRSVPSVSVPTLAEPSQLKKPDTTRRKMLKRMGLAVLAGGAALGITASTYSPAEAKLSVNPSSNVGAVVTRNGASITGIPSSSNYGLVASPDSPSLDASALIFPNFDVGVAGLTKIAGGNNAGVFGRSSSGSGVYGYSSSGPGAYGASDTGIGVVGYTENATSPAIDAKNNAAGGIALQIEQGGFTVKGAGTGTKTAAFIHQTSSTNIPASPNNYRSKIDNPLCNGQSGALLLVTHITTSGPVEFNPLGVYYDGSFWNIAHENTNITMSPGLSFNVLIINP